MEEEKHEIVVDGKKVVYRGAPLPLDTLRRVMKRMDEALDRHRQREPLFLDDELLQDLQSPFKDEDKKP